MTMVRRSGDKSQRGTGGKMPEPKARFRVEYRDERGRPVSKVFGSAKDVDFLIADLRKRKLGFNVYPIR